MELRHLRVALVLADELHFGRAAKRLRVAQSAVSQTLRALEDEVGTPLFDRGRTVRVTPAGAQFLARAREAIGAVERGADEAKRIAAGNSGRLDLRFTMVSALTCVPRAIVRFQRAHPDVHIDLQPGNPTEQLAALHEGRCDVGFMSKRKDVGPLATEIVEEDNLVALLPKGHLHAKKRPARLEDLAGERVIFVRESSDPEVRARFRKRCAVAGIDLDAAMEVDQLEVLLALVAAGAGVSFVPGMVRRLPFPGVVSVPIDPSPRAGISMVWNPRTLTPLARRFLDAVRAERDRA